MAGGDTLNGKAGADSMAGGAGNDLYFVDSVGDVVIEAMNEGSDQVYSTVNYTLGANIEGLVLQGAAPLTGTGNGLSNSIIGNSGSNVLWGLAGDDALNGKEGADWMAGGSGNDSYYVDNVVDVIYETAGSGNDSVYSTVSYALGANIERLALQGSTGSSGSGNGLANTLIGNSGSNILRGMAGDDYIKGGGGSDVFIFAAGDGLDVIADFETSRDGLTFVGIGASQLNFVQSGKDTLISYGAGNVITLVGISASDPMLHSHLVFG
jgi:Ca2+-binding RTX toxin-like protein